MTRTVYTADHLAFRDTVRDFTQRHLIPEHERIIEQRFIDREIWIEAGKLGLLGLEVPEPYGGSAAGDYRFNAVLGEELSRVSAAIGSSFGIHYDIVAPYLVELSTEEQKQRWLPGFCTGELVAAIAMTEPAAGSDLAGLKTTARRDGDDWILNGSKTFITNGYHADLVIVAAQDQPGEEGQGHHPVRRRDRHGRLRAGPQAGQGRPTRGRHRRVVLHRRPGPRGERDRGGRPRLRAHDGDAAAGTDQRAVSNLAHAEAILAETLDYARQRKAFGQAIGSFQYNKFLFAELVTTLEVAQAFVDRCVQAHTERRLTSVDAAKAKWWSSQVQNQILDSCVQLHGGYGFMNEYRVARAWKDARVTKIWAGSNEIMKEIIGRDLGL